MAKAAIMAARAMDAHESVMEMIEQHGNPQYLEELRNITPAVASSRNPEHRDAFVAILHEAQAEMIEALCYENTALKEIVEEQGNRITALENPPAAAVSAATKKK